MTDLSEFDKIDFDGPNNDMNYRDNGGSDSSLTLSGSLTEIIVPLEVASDTISIKNESGQMLQIIEGEVVRDSSMEVVAEHMITRSTGGEDSPVSLAFLVKDSDSFTFSSASKDIKASVISDSYYSNVSASNADSVKITEDETFISGDKVSYDATHSTDHYRCEMVCLGGTIDGDGQIVFADDMISLNGNAGGYFFLDLYIDGKGYTSIPIDIKPLQDGITIDEIMADPCKYGHMLFPHPAVAATSDADGNIAYYTCNTCDKAVVFNDWRKETEISLEDTVIKRIKTLSR